MDDSRFLDLLRGTPLVDEAFAKTASLFREKIRTLIDAGCQYLELGWTEDDVQELHAEGRVALIQKIEQLKVEYEAGQFDDEEFNRRASEYHDTLLEFLATFLQNWVETNGKKRYKQVLQRSGVASRRAEEQLRRSAQSWTDRLKAKRKLRKRLQSMTKDLPHPRRRDDDYYDDYDEDEDEDFDFDPLDEVPDEISNSVSRRDLSQPWLSMFQGMI